MLPSSLLKGVNLIKWVFTGLDPSVLKRKEALVRSIERRSLAEVGVPPKSVRERHPGMV